MTIKTDSELKSSRRNFLKGGIGGAFAIGTASVAVNAFADHHKSIEDLKDKVAGLTGHGDEQFWRDFVKNTYTMNDGITCMNSANMSPTPKAATDALHHYMRYIDSDVSHQNRGVFGEIRTNTRKLVADFLNADVEEIALVRNTTEANNMVQNGLELSAGDEIVLWDQNHPTNNVSWDVRAERYGLKITRVSTPYEPKSIEDLIAPFRKAITSKTKFVGFSHASNVVGGVKLPAKEICEIAHAVGAKVLVDGAQSAGAFKVDLKDINCDFYTSSSQKWLVGPREAGLLFVRKDRIAGHWPTIVGSNWGAVGDSGTATRFESLGQQENGKLAALGKTMEINHALGIERIEKRMYEITGALIDGLSQVPGVHVHSPRDDSLRGGVVRFRVAGIDVNTGGDMLYKQFGIGCRVWGGEHDGVRFSPHYYNTMEDIEKGINAIKSIVA